MVLYSSLVQQFLDAENLLINSLKIISTLLIGVVVLIVFFVFKLAYSRYSLSKVVPCYPVGFFDFLGNLRNLREILKKEPNINVAFAQYALQATRDFKNSKLSCFWMSFWPTIFIIKAEALEALVGGTKTNKKSMEYDYLHPWLGTGLLTSYGPKWKSRRKLLTPSFHFEILKDFLPVFNEQSAKLVKVLQEETTKDFTSITKPVAMCALDIICETTLGVSINAQEEKESEYINAVIRTSDSIVARPFNMSYWFDITFNLTELGRRTKKDVQILKDFTLSVIKEKKQKLLSSDPSSEVPKKKRKALMDLLLEHNIQTKDLTDEDIREEVDTFAFEGHDTTSMGMSWAMYLIGRHPDVQERLHEEMDRIFGDDTERHCTTDDIKDMTYLDIVLKETQRIYPSVPYIGREATEDLDICGYHFPKGTQFTILIYCLHRDEKYFPDPEKFDPDRFLPENTVNRHPFAFAPFSAGPRNCIGQRFAVMEEKIVLSHILRNFTLESLDPQEKMRPAPDVVLRTDSPIRIKVRPRKR